LFKSYFEEEQDPAAHEILARDAETAGIMSKSEALEFLKSDELSKEVQEGIKKAQLRGISGVSSRFAPSWVSQMIQGSSIVRSGSVHYH